MKNKLIIVAHPKYNLSKVVKTFIEEIEKKAIDTDIHVLPQDGNFDIVAEQQLLLQYHTISFAFPIWWYTAPWILKKYFDEIISPGFAFTYGPDISKFQLRNKKIGLLISAGSPKETYTPNGGNLNALTHHQLWIKTLAHFICTAWINPAGNKDTSESIYWYEPIISYGAALGLETPLVVAEKYLTTIDNQ